MSVINKIINPENYKQYSRNFTYLYGWYQNSGVKIVVRRQHKGELLDYTKTSK